LEDAAAGARSAPESAAVPLPDLPRGL
jgi:hypothetical protein